MATRDEVKSELLSKIDETFPEDRELDQDGDVPLLAQTLGLSDEETENLLEEIDSEPDDSEEESTQDNG